MLLRIMGVEHDLQEVLRRPSLNDLYYLKVKSRSPEYPSGMSLGKLGEYLQKMGQLETPADAIDDPDILLALKGVVFLCRRRAGEKVTWEEAGDLEMGDLEFVVEDSDEPVLTDAANDPPVAPPDSEGADVAPLAGP